MGLWFTTATRPQTQLKKSAKSRPTVRKPDHGLWSVFVDRGPLFPASDANDGRPAQSVVRSTVHCAAEDCSATLVEIADELGDPPFGQLIAISFLPLASSHFGSLGGTVPLRGTNR
uniref:Uncharacterized protein n=1 Tax=Solanum tuberosum TaxID=4113 RepID=M1DDU6_SOLTU